MHQSKENNKKDIELADFTDRVLGAEQDKTASTTDVELLSLENTILRLAETFPQEILTDAKAKQMLVRIKAGARRTEEEQAALPSFWKRLFDFQSNPQAAMLIAVAAVMVLVIVNLPASQNSDSSMAGTSFSVSSLFPALGVVGILLVLYWISRRK